MADENSSHIPKSVSVGVTLALIVLPLLVGGFFLAYDLIGSEDETETSQASPSSKGAAKQKKTVQAQNPCGEPKVVTARRGNPITVHGRGKKCRWDIRRDRSAGEENYLAAVEMRPNGNKRNAQIDGLVDDEYRNPAFSMSVDFFEIEPVTASKVRLVVGFVPTN